MPVAHGDAAVLRLDHVAVLGVLRKQQRNSRLVLGGVPERLGGRALPAPELDG